MKKRIYRRMPVNEFQPQSISPSDLGERLVFAIDIAKVDMVAAFAASDGRVLHTICWKASQENSAVLGPSPGKLACPPLARVALGLGADFLIPHGAARPRGRARGCRGSTPARNKATSRHQPQAHSLRSSRSINLPLPTDLPCCTPLLAEPISCAQLGPINPRSSCLHCRRALRRRLSRMPYAIGARSHLHHRRREPSDDPLGIFGPVQGAESRQSLEREGHTTSDEYTNSSTHNCPKGRAEYYAFNHVPNVVAFQIGIPHSYSSP